MGSCKFSTLKTIRAIAFMDLIDAVIFAVYRGISLSILLAKIPTKADKEMASTSLRPNTIILSGKGGHSQIKREDDDQSDGTAYMRYWSVILLTGIVMTFAVEVFLFLLLNSGAPMRNLRHCKHWFFMRVLMLCFGIAGSIIDFLLGEYTLISGLLEVEKVYRLVTLVVMWRFMYEIKTGTDFENSKFNFGTDIGSSNVFGSFSQAP